MKERNPMQPFVVDQVGTIRFKANQVVRWLLDHGRQTGMSLNELDTDNFSQDDLEQFYQLIGYSLSGYHELNEVSDQSALEASHKAREQWPDASGCRDIGCEVHCGVAREDSA